MNRSKQRKINLLQLVVGLISIVLIVYVGGTFFVRLDLTSEKRFTLDKSSVSLMKSLQDQVFVKIYLEGDELPIGFLKLQRSIKEILDELKIYAQDNLEYKFVNITISSDKETRAKAINELVKQGLKPIELKEKNKTGKESQSIVIPGAILSYKGFEIPINLLKNTKGVSAETNLNNSIQSLEYELTNAMRKLITERMPQIAFIEGHGELNEYETMDMSRILSEYYEVKRGKIGGKFGLLDSFAAVILARPTTPIDEKDKYVLDQYVMNGGKLIIFADGTSASKDSLMHSGSTIVIPNDLHLEDLTFKYGARINYNLAMDIQCDVIGLSTPDVSGRPTIKYFPWYFSPIVASDNKHSITKYVNVIKTDFVSTIDTVGNSSKIKKTILLTTSKFTRTQLSPFKLGIDVVYQQPQQSMYRNANQPVAVLLEGKFESLFKNRLINQFDGYQHFKAESKSTKILIISDGDIIRNDVSEKGEPFPLGFNRFTRQQFSGNSEFILNAVNYLTDDEGLMTIRAREIKLRLLDKTKIEENRSLYQTTNILLPIVIVILFGLFMNWKRKKRYATKQK